MNATRSATEMVPVATRYPPRPSTAMKDPWTAMDAAGETSASSRAARTPAS